MTSGNDDIYHVDFHISYTCNRACDFCSEAGRMSESRVGFIPADTVIEKLQSLKQRNIKMVLFTGGEIFLHPELKEIVEAASKMSLRVGLSTNGSCVDPVFFDSIARRVYLLQVSFHAHEKELFDGVVGQPGSFEKLESFIEHAKKHVGKIYFMANVVMTRKNGAFITDTVRKICSYETFKMILLSNMAPEGRALENYADLALPLTDIAATVDRVKHFLWRGNIELHVFGVPFCVLGRHGANSNDIFWRPRLHVELDPDASGGGEAVLKEILFASCSRERTKPAKCSECSCNLDNFCGGVFTRYLEEFGDEEISPVRTGMSLPILSA